MLSEQRIAVLEEAATWLGTPFCNNGHIKGAGISCGSFLFEVYKAAGVLTELPPLESFGQFPLGWSLHTKEEKYIEILERFMQPVKQPQPGDTALFKFAGVYGHAGIVVAWPRIIHVAVKRKVEYYNATNVPLSLNVPKFFSPFLSHV